MAWSGSRGLFLNPGANEATATRSAAGTTGGRVTEGQAAVAWIRSKVGKGSKKWADIAEAGGFSPNDQVITIARDLEAGTDSEGGYTVNDGLVGGLVKARITEGVIRSRATLFPRDNGVPFSVATVDDTANYAAVVAEEDDQTGGTHMAFGRADLTPLKLATKILRISEELMADAQFDMASFLGTSLGERCYRGLEYYATVGTGVAGVQPQGVVVGGSVGVTAASETAITSEEIIELVASLDPMHRNNPTSGIMMNNTTVAAIQTLKDGQGKYLLRPLAERPMTIQGMTIIINPHMPDAATGTFPIAAGDFANVGISEVRGIDVLFLNELYREAGQIGVRAILRANAAVLNSSAIKLLQMA